MLVKSLTNWFASPLRFVEALTDLWRSLSPASTTNQDAEAENAEPKERAISPVLPAEVETNIDAEKSDDQSQAEVAVDIALVQQGDENRRKLIRALFNQFWADVIDKPATFAERLDAAEDYINAQLAARSVGWRLDDLTRRQLGLPMSTSSGPVAEADMKSPKRTSPRRRRGRSTDASIGKVVRPAAQ
jgi:hypothetical protein